MIITKFRRGVQVVLYFKLKGKRMLVISKSLEENEDAVIFKLKRKILHCTLSKHDVSEDYYTSVLKQAVVITLAAL
jgi:hypothetical protein